MKTSKKNYCIVITTKCSWVILKYEKITKRSNQTYIRGKIIKMHNHFDDGMNFKKWTTKRYYDIYPDRDKIFYFEKLKDIFGDKNVFLSLLKG